MIDLTPEQAWRHAELDKRRRMPAPIWDKAVWEKYRRKEKISILMPALNIRKRLAGLVLDGTKKQTIRAGGKRPIQEGDRLYFYTGLFTRYCRLLGDSVCVSAASIRIEAGTVRLNTGGLWRLLDAQETARLARADGFDCVEAFFQFFQKHGGFIGQLIRWQAPINTYDYATKN